MEIARDEVRVMTVHGAKGLEAPIVILADTTTRAGGPPAPAAAAGAAGANAAPGTPDRLVWAAARTTTSRRSPTRAHARCDATTRTNIAGCSTSR